MIKIPSCCYSLFKYRRIAYHVIGISFVIVLLSCQERNSRLSGTFILEKSDEQLCFLLDERTKNDPSALFPYTDETGKEWLTFQNWGQNDILFYDMDSGELGFRIKPQYEGSNGVGSFHGYHIKSMDSIFLTTRPMPEIVMIDRNATVKRKFQYEKTTDNLLLMYFYSTSSTNHPIMIMENKMYIMPMCNRWAEISPVCATIDLTDYTVEALPDFSYPSFPGADNKAKTAGIEIYVSRCYDGEKFIYAFYFDESVYIASPDHKTVHRKEIKSRYIDKVKLLDDYGNLTIEDMCENPNYGNMLYDEYRDVYYRVAYPETKIDRQIRGIGMELMQYGRKNFSIIILDRKLNIIGETMFPDYTYNSNIMFIREDGLYISSSHSMNPEFSDDELCFHRFDLVKEHD
ncbi:MAG: DUF4221 domain-containing protein [Tannerellaceae bacterium]|jgi:hypothetical protein|nr:DUF4221 domain-containing protein [Tannerellaceae bacterium]